MCAECNKRSCRTNWLRLITLQKIGHIIGNLRSIVPKLILYFCLSHNNIFTFHSGGARKKKRKKTINFVEKMQITSDLPPLLPAMREALLPQVYSSLALDQEPREEQK
mgnify:CR=1 FL=1